MRSYPDDEATLNLLGCFKKEVWIWEPAEESDADESRTVFVQSIGDSGANLTHLLSVLSVACSVKGSPRVPRLPRVPRVNR